MKRNLKIMYLINLLNEMKFYGIILVLYYIQLSGSMTLGMSIFSIVTISTAICEIPTGLLSDKVGRKNTVILGTICSLISVVVLALSTNYLGLLIASIFQGLEKAFFSGNNSAFVYDILKEEKRENEFKNYLGKNNSMLYLAGVISSILGTIIVAFTSYKFVIVLSIIPKIIQFILSITLKNVRKYSKENENIFKSMKEPIKKVFENKIIRKQVIADGMIGGIEEACFQFRTTFYETLWPTWAIGIPNLLANLGAFISNWNGDKIIKKVGEKTIIIFSNIYDMISTCLAVLTNNMFSPIIMVSNSVIPADIAEEEIEQKYYSDEYRATMGSIKSLFESILFSIIAILVGVVADRTSIAFTFIVFQLVKIVPIYIYLRIFRDMNNKTSRQLKKEETKLLQ